MARWTDERVEQVVGSLLRVGVIASAAIVLAGGIHYLAQYGWSAPHYAVFAGEPADLRSPTGIVADALALRSRGLIQLGLLLLIATPVARVAFAAFAFAMEHDRLYVVVALVVLALLTFSLTGGHL